MITIFENYMPRSEIKKTFELGDYVIMNDNCSDMFWYNIYGQVIKHLEKNKMLTIKIMNNMSKSELSNIIGLKPTYKHGYPICTAHTDYVNKYEPDEFFKRVEQIEFEREANKYNL